MSLPDIHTVAQIRSWLGTGSLNVFGIQFSGKDTQAHRLAELLDGVPLSGGDILRASHDKNLVATINTGDLAPTNTYLATVLPALSKPDLKGKPLILSTVGRWHGEESAVMQAAETSGHPLKAVIYLQLPESEAWKRWELAGQRPDRTQGQRADDTKEGLERRITEFNSKTLPVIKFYRDKGLLVEVDGSLSMEAVTTQIITKLAEKAAN